MDGVVADGHPSWVDLSTADLAAAKDFYTALFGWTLASNATPMGDHVVGSVADREVAGMVAQPPQMAGAPSVWTVFFYVEDLDDTVASITTTGGRVLQEPFAIPDGARVSVVADPGGAMFALISDRRQPGPYLSHVLGAVSWIELTTHDVETAENFYRRVFGWDATTDNAGGALHTVFSLDATPIGGLADKPTDVSAEVPEAWSVWFTVADCAATARLAAERGGRIIRPCGGTAVRPGALLTDPQGAVFQILEHTRSVP